MSATEKRSTGAALPTTSNREDWTEDEAAAIEAAGLVFTYPYGEKQGQRVLAPRPVVTQFLHLAEKTGLDPLARQIYCIPRLGRDGIEWSMQTGIDGFRVIAERSGKYAGQRAAEWLTEGGEWVTVFIKAKHGANPLAARVAVHRHDWDRELPAVGIATWDEYVQTKSNGEVTKMWKERGPGQLAKCAEALALRKAFPQDLSGLYTAEEMDQADNVVELGEAVDPTAPRSRVSKALDAPPEPSSPPVGAQYAEDAPEPPRGRTAAPEADPVPASSGKAQGAAIAGAEERRSKAEAAPVTAVACARCGTMTEGIEPGQICPDCEVEVEAEIAAEVEGS